MEIFTCVLKMIGGLAIFLYSMKIMSAGLEAAAGNKLKTALEKLTSNRFLGLLVGVVLMALVQSSSTTTVMTVGFVNAGLMTLTQALWVIMGANVGTNITSQLIAFDIGWVASIVAITGVIIVLIAKGKSSLKPIGEILAGLGFIFISMDIMSGAMAPMIENEAFVNMMSKMQNPLLGILIGAAFVAIIQSSAAGVGVLQAMAIASAGSNVITLEQAVFLLFGMNIGTCITAMLSSVGTTRMAKRTALMHLTFNVIGAVLMTIIAFVCPFTDFIEKLSPNDVARQIANAHLCFNVITTVILLPCGKLIVKFVNWILPDKKEENEDEFKLQFLTPSLLNLKDDTSPAMTEAFIASAQNEVNRMLAMAGENITRSFDAVLENSQTKQAEIDKHEEYIDFLNKEISYYISHCLSYNITQNQANKLSALFKITGNIERLGDHATNISGYANLLEEKGIKLSDLACEEVRKMVKVTEDSTGLLFDMRGEKLHVRMAKAEQLIDDMTKEFRINQLERMKSGACSGEACVIYSEMLTDFERLGDHLLNIAEAASENRMEIFALEKAEA